MDGIKKCEDFLDRMQGLLDNAKKQGHIIVRVEDLENAFPELRESKDEKIIEEIKFAIMQMPSQRQDTKNECLAWLEKQGQTFTKKDVDDAYLTGVYDAKQELEKQGEQKSDWSEEDERVRKELVTFLEELSKLGKDTNFDRWKTSDCANWIAWLEKQGEQKTQGKSALETIKEEKVDNANKVEPKFKVGDWCIDNEDGTIFQIVKVLDNTYTYKTNVGKEYSCTHYSLENDAKLWTIQDAKDGNVLYSPAHNILWIYKDKERYHAAINLNYAIFVSFNADIVIIPSDVQPATKEQSARLFQKMKEAGYEWDEEKKELKHYEKD